MSQPLRFVGMMLFLLSLANATPVIASEPASLSEGIGPEIDREERDAYHLLPGVEGFETARLFREGEKAYRLEYTYRDGAELRTRSRRIPAEAFDQTRLHVVLLDSYREAQASGPDSLNQAALLQFVALRFASDARYDLASGVAEQLRSDFHDTEPGRWADQYGSQLAGLARRPPMLISRQSLIDQRGRGDLIVFSGFYGLWLGVAVPAALRAENAQVYAAGLLATPSLAVLIASSATHNADITEGQATMISLGGRLGTWQGLGWSAAADAEGHAILSTGVLAGLTGILVAVPIAKAGRFSEGHAAITSSSMYWGGWFGAVAGKIAGDDQNDHGVLRDMLIGSDVLVLASAIGARDAKLSEGRMRLINLSGVLGTAFGLGLDMLFEVDNSTTAIAIAGFGSAAGLGIGASLTKNYDRDRDLASGVSVQFPQMSMRGGLGKGEPRVPTLGLVAKF